MIYLVYYEIDGEQTSVVSAHKDLEKANDYARREIADTWRVQDGFEYVEMIRENGTKSYKVEIQAPYYRCESCYVEKIELKD